MSLYKHSNYRNNNLPVLNVTGEQIAISLDGKPSGKDRWRACCPAHNDKNPSLAVTETSTGTVLVHCFSGCPQDAVIDALRDRGLWQAEKAKPSNRVNPDDLEWAETVLMIADHDRRKGLPISDKDMATLKRAIGIVQKSQGGNHA